MRIAWFSNAPWAGTGYGAQTAAILPRLRDAGHEVAAVSNYGLQGSPIDWNGIPVLPQGYDAWSNDLAGAHVRNWVQAQGWGIILYDVWTIKGSLWDGQPLAAWVPVDHDPAPAEVASWFSKPGEKRVAIAMSRFGESRLKAAGVKDVLYAPHSVDIDLFTPEGENFRAQLGIPEDAFVIVANAANKGVPSRKSFPEMLLAFADFAQAHPDAYLYLHTESLGLAGGVNLPRLIAATGAPADRVKFAPQYQYRSGIPSEEIPKVYRMGDVLLMPSRGEGFGVPSIEAQACGVPVICSKWTAQPELVGGGWLVGGQPEWNEPMGSWFLAPSVPDILEALEQAYQAKADGSIAQLKLDARAKAELYAHDRVFREYWLPVLAALQERLAPPLNREQRRKKERGVLKGKAK